MYLYMKKNQVGIQKNVLHLCKDKDDPRRLSISQAKERRGKRKLYEKVSRQRSQSSLLRCAFENQEMQLPQTCCMKLLRQLLKGLPKFHWLGKKKKKLRGETKVYSDEEAISLLVEAQLSKKQYITITLQAKTKGCNNYPSYNKFRAAKERCYPDSIIVTEDECKVKLQQLLDHIAKCLLLAQQEAVTAAAPAEETSNLVLFSKWGCDCSTGHSQYKQKGSAESFSDANLFLSSLVPLQLQLHEEDSSADIRASTSTYSGPVRILWHNPRPSLT